MSWEIRMGDALANMTSELHRYARSHEKLYGSPLAEDAVLGEAWISMVRGALGLLNGELGKNDGGTLDRRLRDMAWDAGFQEEEFRTSTRKGDA